MNYEKASDFEINRAVSEVLGGMYALRECREAQRVVFVLDHKRVVKDYCNNPADAWPVIAENKISIIAPENGIQHWDAVAGEYLVSDQTNPLRAAMIVFLLMQEHKELDK